MNIKLIVVGKTDKKSIEDLMEKYFKRIKRYINFDFFVIKDIKNSKSMSEGVQKSAEGEKILETVVASDFVVLLDENGQELSSRGFADFISKSMLSSTKTLVFVIGGPYGFSNDIYNRANYKISLSKMTFSHQIIRLIFAEQLYRSFTIINNEPYHHS